MAASYVAGAQAGDAQTAITASLAVTIPSSSAVGDVAIVEVISNKVTSNTLTVPTGWTLLSGPDALGTTTVGWLLGKTLVSGDPGSSVTFTVSVSGRMVAVCGVARGVTLSGAQTPSPALNTSGSTTQVFPTQASVPAGAFIFGVASGQFNGTLAQSLTTPTSWTAGSSANTAYTTVPEVMSEFFYRVAGSGGSYGGDTVTGTQAYTGIYYLTALPVSSAVTAAGSVDLGGSGVASAPDSAAGTVALDGSAGASFKGAGAVALGGSAGASFKGAGAVALGGSATATAPAAAASGSVALGGQGLAPSSAAGAVSLGGSASGVAVVAPPLKLPVIVSPSARWSWAAGAWGGLPTNELAHASTRSLKLRLTGSSEASFTLTGNAAEVPLLQELVSDVWAIRNGFTLFRGRVGPTHESSDGTTVSADYSAGDYRAILARRLLFDADTLAYSSRDQSVLAFNLISTTQGHVGGNLNISDGSTPTGVNRALTYQAGQSIGDAIEQLSLMDSGFNWDIVPTTGQVGQVFTTWRSRGQSAGRVLDFPGRIKSYTRAVDPGTYANAVRETGNTGLAAVRAESTGLATAPEGRWDVQLGDTAMLDAASVASRATYDLSSRQMVVPTYTVVLQPGTWGGPPDIWLGDSLTLYINTPYRQAQDTLQVFEIDIDLDDAGNETVTMTLSALDPFKRSRARQYDYRITKLERR